MVKAQAVYEKELETLKSSRNVSNDEQYSQLQQQFEDFKKCSSIAEREAKQKIEDLSNQLLCAEELKTDLMSRCSGLGQQEASHQLEINSLRQQVDSVL